MLGKPLGMVAVARWRSRLGLARQARRVLAGGSSRARARSSGIGFTMSLFIAAQAFPVATDFAAAKIAVFGASIVAAVAGVAILWGAERRA